MTSTDTASSTDTSSTTPSTLPADDPRSLLATAAQTAGATLAGVTDDQLGLPTPCTGMTVRELAEHLVMVTRRVASAGRDEPLDTWAIDAADVCDGGWAEAFRTGAADAAAAWSDDATLDRPTTLPWTTCTGAEALGIYTNELTVHTWDLARATGQAPAWDPAVLATSLEHIHRELPMAERGPMWAEARAYLPEGVEWQDPFADAVPVADDAPLIERLVAWNGRTP